MKRIHIFFTILIFCILLVSCGQHNSSSSSDNALESETTEVLITVPDNVSEVVIVPRYIKEMTFKYTDASKIDAIVSYISDLGILSKTTATDPELFVGSYQAPMNYEITLNTSDGNTEVYYLLGNNYFKQGQEGVWCDIEYETRIAFRDMMQELEPDVPAKVPLFRDITITVPENVTEVIVTNTGTDIRIYQYTEPEKVNAIVSYISDLGTLKNSENAGYYGERTIIILYSADGTSEAYYMLGDSFLQQGEHSSWCNIKSGDAQRLEELLQKYESDVPEEVQDE